MKCPTCLDQSLVMTERHGIEIDYCPTCRGVWLDRGELDKIIERAATQYAPPVAAAAMPAPVAAAPQPYPQPQYQQPAPPPQSNRRWDDDDDDDDDDYRRRQGGEYSGKKKKRGSFLGEIFDFG